MSANRQVPDVWEEDWESQADVCEIRSSATPIAEFGGLIWLSAMIVANI